MNLKEAKGCKIGNVIIAKNGPHTQIGIITKKEPHQTGGFWITYEWMKNGRTKEATKRHQSVELREMNAMERVFSRGSHRDDSDRLCNGSFIQTDSYREHMEAVTEYTCIKCGKVETCT